MPKITITKSYTSGASATLTSNATGTTAGTYTYTDMFKYEDFSFMVFVNSIGTTTGGASISARATLDGTNYFSYTSILNFSAGGGGGSGINIGFTTTGNTAFIKTHNLGEGHDSAIRNLRFTLTAYNVNTNSAVSVHFFGIFVDEA